MHYESCLLEAILVRRYQRFLADVRLGNGKTVVAHVPNSGRLTGVFSPGRRCWLQPVLSGKLPYRMELVAVGNTLVGVNTLRAAKLAEEALTSGLLCLPGLEGPFSVRREVKVCQGTRLDFKLHDAHGSFWLEVKNITLVENGEALFPDAVTARGAKHMACLAELARAGERAGVIYVVQRGDAQRVRAAERIDPTYARMVWEAAGAGVVFAALQVRVTPQELAPERELPVVVMPPKSEG